MTDNDLIEGVTKQLTNATKWKGGEENQSFEDRADTKKLTMLIKI